MAWIALRRVSEGGVAVLEDSYYHHGRLVPEYLNTPLAELVRSGYLTVAGTGTGMRQISLTQQGCDWYAVLCGKTCAATEPAGGDLNDHSR